jgi:hypothetical protein
MYLQWKVFKPFPFFWLSFMSWLYYNISGLLDHICFLVHLVFLKRVCHHKLRNNRRREQSGFYYLFHLSCILFKFVKFLHNQFFKRSAYMFSTMLLRSSKRLSMSKSSKKSASVAILTQKKSLCSMETKYVACIIF